MVYRASILALASFVAAQAQDTSAPYVCLNDAVPIASPPDPQGSFFRCLGQTWEPWACWHDQIAVNFPIPEGIPLQNPLPGPFATVLYQLSTRLKLQAVNFINGYSDSANMPDGPGDCGDSSYRTLDGTCNNADDSAEGSAYTNFARNTPHVDQSDSLYTPNPRTVAQELFTRAEYTPDPRVNVLSVGWIQFMLHDWFNHEVDVDGEPLRCPLGFGGDDAEAEAAGMSEFVVAPSKRADGEEHAFVNTETHWWDASQLYGVKPSVAKKLRVRNTSYRGPNKHNGGKYMCELRLESDGTLPKKGDEGELLGFSNNQWSGLSTMHNLFTREHNFICGELAVQHPEWSYDRQYNTARKIVNGLLAKIHTVEWTTAYLDHPALTLAMNINWRGSLAMGLPVDVPALKGNPRAPLPGAFHAMTEEFVSVYRMHSLLPDYFDMIRTNDTHTVAETLPLKDVVNEKVPEVNQAYTQADLLLSFGVQPAGALQLFNYPNDLRRIEQEDGTFVDLATVELLRDRERGVPRYNQFRRSMQLNPITSFAQLSDDPQVTAKLQALYSDVEEIDLMVGLMGEQCRPNGFVFSESAFQVFIVMATQRLASDGFFTDKWTPEYYTEWGLNHVESNTMSDVLARHHPEVAGLQQRGNAFFPWQLE